MKPTTPVVPLLTLRLELKQPHAMRLRNGLVGFALVISIAAIPVLRETGLWNEWFATPSPEPIPSIGDAPRPPQTLAGLTARMKGAMAAQNPTGLQGQPFAPPPPVPGGKSGQIRLLFVLGDLGSLDMGSEDYRAWMRLVREEKLFGAATTLTNDLIALDRDLMAYFKECGGTANAWFSPSERSVTFCYELMVQFASLFAPYAQSRDDLILGLRGAALFVYLHEIGHAMVRELDIPVTGMEEVAVDQFATLLLQQLGDEGEQAVLAAASFFQLAARARAASGEPVVLWDEHPLDEQRFFNLACWLYGANPYRNVHLVARGALPENRAARCGDEYQQMRRSWKTLLDGKLRRPLK